MFKVIPFEDDDDNVLTTSTTLSLFEMSDILSYIDERQFRRTLVNNGTENILSLMERSSWTYRDLFKIKLTNNMKRFIDSHNINTKFDKLLFTLLKYREGDFFKEHIDRVLSPDHIFNCLIFVHIPEHPYKGGDLILRDKNNTYKIIFEPSKIQKTTMVIFSLDMFHEVTPITEGTRYVFKTSLYKSNDILDNQLNSDSDYENNNQGLMDCGHGDY